MSANRAGSIRVRLKNLSDAKREDFHRILTYYAIERLLYRLSLSCLGPQPMFAISLPPSDQAARRRRAMNPTRPKPASIRA